MVFQNPYGSLNPRSTVGRILEEPLAINTRLSPSERHAAGRDMLAKVGLRADQYGRYPHMFSGGQRQRIAIARALMLRPRVVIADEPVSALDVSIQGQILNLLMDLQDEFRLAYLFVSHDLGVVHHLADEVMVMYLGRPVEHGETERVFDQPRHPYTQALLASRPKVKVGGRAERRLLTGELPSPLNPPPGCAFHKRCPYATERCTTERPEPRTIQGRSVACHHADNLPAKAA
jgi:dipeptide transport system ATP-binding protein